MIEYKIEDDPVHQRIQQQAIQNMSDSEQIEEKEIPEEFFQIEPLIARIIEIKSIPESLISQISELKSTVKVREKEIKVLSGKANITTLPTTPLNDKIAELQSIIEELKGKIGELQLSYFELSNSINDFNNFIDQFNNYANEIVDFIQNFEKTEIFRNETFFGYLIDIFNFGQSPILMLNLLKLLNTIIMHLPFDYYFSYLKDNLDESLINMIVHPSNGLQMDHGINGEEINFIGFDTNTNLARNYVINIIHLFIRNIYEKYQENQQKELFDYCYEISMNCLIPCSEVFDIIFYEKVTINQLLFLTDFLNFLLSIVFYKHERINLEPYGFTDDSEFKLISVIEILTKYVINPENPKINIAFSNLSKLVQMVKMLNYFNEKFFSEIFRCFINVEKYRLENQKSMVDLLCSIASMYNYNVIRTMLNVFHQFHIESKEKEGSGDPLMILLSQNSHVEERRSFCHLCRKLIENCFEEFKIRKICVIFPDIITTFLKQQIFFHETQESGFESQQSGSIGQPNFFVIQDGLVFLQNWDSIQKNGFILVNGFALDNPKKEEIFSEDQQRKFDEQQRYLFKLKSDLNALGRDWIDFLYGNNIFFILCDMALNEESYANKTSAAYALSMISPFLPASILADLITNHDFIEIFHQLVGGEKDVYKSVIYALNSILSFLSSSPTDSNSVDLYFKLANTNLLNEIEDCGKSHEDHKLMGYVDSILQKAVVERDRFTAYLLSQND